jgi:hypothetical protein
MQTAIRFLHNADRYCEWKNNRESMGDAKKSKKMRGCRSVTGFNALLSSEMCIKLQRTDNTAFGRNNAGSQALRKLRRMRGAFRYAVKRFT